MSLQSPCVFFGKCRSQRSDAVVDAAFKRTDQIKLPFKNNRLLRFVDRTLGFIQPEESFAFFENRSLGRVYVLAATLPLLDMPTTESDRLSVIIIHRKHQTMTEKGIRPALLIIFVTPLGQTAIHQLLYCIAL